MADFLMHILLSDDVLEKIESRRVLEGIQRYRTLYRLGAQGPDPLFFYEFISGGKRSPLRELGHTMHKKHTGAFLKMGFSRLQKVSWEQEWLELAAYLSGFICHFTLDRLIHPYVYWAAENWIWSVDGRLVSTTHQAVEMALDVLFWKERRMSSACKVKTRKYVDIGRQWPKSVRDFLLEAFASLYGVRADEKSLNRVLSDFYRGHDLLYDPRGWKKALIGWLDAFTGGGIKPPKVPYPALLDETVDWANRKRRTWTHPFKAGEAHRESVDEILSKASFEAANHINGVFAGIRKGEPIDGLFPDLSYDTGLPCDGP
ncbi:MAG TPA: zinc dependent phospholipase C family protein [Thermoclostridium caenicola]|nr:zinc dependent phospholipase C family protein [Thermoclostridium caenicola]